MTGISNVRRNGKCLDRLLIKFLFHFMYYVELKALVTNKNTVAIYYICAVEIYSYIQRKLNRFREVII